MRGIVAFVVLLAMIVFSAGAEEGISPVGKPESGEREVTPLATLIDEALDKGECDEGLSLLERLRKTVPRQAVPIIATLHENGLCVPTDTKKAFQLIKEGAEKWGGFLEPRLGDMYLNGIGTPKDKNKATYWFKKAAYWMGANPPSEFFMFLRFHSSGREIPQGLHDEIAWVKEVEEGAPEQLYSLALRIRDGDGLPKDCKMADRWMTFAALSKLPKALYEYGKWMVEGTCVKINVEMGLKWISRAADAGYVKAQKFLGLRLASQKPSEVSNVAAHYWLSRAQSSGASVKEILLKVKARMTEDEKRIVSYYGEGDVPPPLK